jgi:dihydrofolate reductase
MRTLIVTEFVSLDGVMEAPGGEPGYVHSGWVTPYVDDDLLAYKGEEQLDATALVLGRLTYESFAGAWPDRSGPMADQINTMEKCVVSTTMDPAATGGDPRWTNASVIRTLDDVAEIRAGEGGDILVVGSRTLAQALLLAGLVDELHLQIFPVILGSGRRFYPDGPQKFDLELTGSKRSETGVLLQEFAVAR